MLMKRLLLLSTLALGLAVSVQAQITQLTITVNTALMPDPNCNLNAGVVPNNKVYIHSGMCSSNATNCAGIACSGSTVWESVIGNWGMDDGVGLMNSLGNGIFSITIPAETYYNLATGAVPYSMGLVFRSADGSITGKDNTCGDIFIRNIQTTPQAVNCSGDVYEAVTVSKTVVGIEDPSFLSALTVSPNPAKDRVTIDYQLRKGGNAITARIMDTQGRMVADLYEGRLAPGQHRMFWDGSNAAAGLYFFVLREGNNTLATQKILLTK
jgi:hypothetical protein